MVVEINLKKMDTDKFIHASLFSGIGGNDLAAEWAGWITAFHCEVNPFCQQILKYYWPNAESFGNIQTTDFKKYANKIDVLTGGFPCQPYSLSGKRLGKDDVRHLWPEMLRAIREIKPRYVVGENVPGIISWGGGLVFEQVQTDLENEGYEVWPIVLPACSVGAPHRRDRVWFIAHSNSERSQRRGPISDIQETNKTFREKLFVQINRFSEKPASTNANVCYGFDLSRYEACKRRKIKKHSFSPYISNDESITNSNSIGLWGEINGTGKSKFFDQTNQITDWSNWPTQSSVCRGDDGVSSKLVGVTVSKHRVESLKGFGNAIVPQVVYQIFKTINQYETINKMP